MAVFITCTTDAFAETFAEAVHQGRTNPRVTNVRRPLRGIQVKTDTYATIRVKTAGGTDIPLFDSGADQAGTQGSIGRSTLYSNFLMQRVQEERVEKQQIVETFGEDYIYFFGERPRFLNITGLLLNTADFNWKSEFWTNYEQFLRGTKLVEQNARMYLYFDDVVVEGYLMSAATTAETGNPHLMPMQMQMFVSNYSILSSVGSVLFQGGLINDGVPPETAEVRTAQAEAAFRIGATGGLLGFLASASPFFNDLSFGIQSTLENIQNTFYGRQLVVPEGIGQTLAVAPLQNRAVFTKPAVNQPIYTMRDEYIGSEPAQPGFDQAEIDRVNAELALRDPKAMEIRARAKLEELGVDTSRPSETTLLLGRGAFAATQYVAPFGVRAAGGTISDTPVNGFTLISEGV